MPGGDVARDTQLTESTIEVLGLSLGTHRPAGGSGLALLLMGSLYMASKAIMRIRGPIFRRPATRSKQERRAVMLCSSSFPKVMSLSFHGKNTIKLLS